MKVESREIKGHKSTGGGIILQGKQETLTPLSRATSLGRNKWKLLVGPWASLQHNCDREGFNVRSNIRHYSKARIGITANNQNNCGSCNSRIGFGTGGKPDDNNTCGNERIKAMGYILVQ